MKLRRATLVSSDSDLYQTHQPQSDSLHNFQGITPQCVTGKAWINAYVSKVFSGQFVMKLQSFVLLEEVPATVLEQALISFQDQWRFSEALEESTRSNVFSTFKN